LTARYASKLQWRYSPPQLCFFWLKAVLPFLLTHKEEKIQKQIHHLSRKEGIERQIYQEEYWLEENILQPAKRQVMRFAVGKVGASFHFACLLVLAKKSPPFG